MKKQRPVSSFTGLCFYYRCNMAEMLQAGVRIIVDEVPLEEAIVRYTNLIVQGLKDTSADTNPLRKQFDQWAVVYRKQAQGSYDVAATGGWKRLSSVTIALKQKQKRALGALASKAPVSDALRASDTMRGVLNPRFTGQAGAVEIQRINGIELGYGGNAVHPAIKKKDIAAVKAASEAKGPRKISTNRLTKANNTSVLGNVSKFLSGKNKKAKKKKKRARKKGPITVAQVAKIHNEGLGLPKRSIDDHVYLEASQETAKAMGELTLAAVTELAERAGFGTE